MFARYCETAPKRMSMILASQAGGIPADREEANMTHRTVELALRLGSDSDVGAKGNDL
jgi:hypothetical protein